MKQSDIIFQFGLWLFFITKTYKTKKIYTNADHNKPPKGTRNRPSKKKSIIWIEKKIFIFYGTILKAKI